MSYVAEIPTLVEELDRKVVDVLTEAHLRVDSGVMTPEDAALVGKTLWDATSGLVSREVSDLCARTANSAGAHRHTAHFVKASSAVTVYWSGAKDDYVVVNLDLHTGIKKPHQISVPVGDQKVHLDKLFSVLVKSNYRKL